MIDLMAASLHAWNPDQYNNPDNVDCDQSLALELLDQLGSIDVLACSVGAESHSAGVARVLRQANPDLELIGVDNNGFTIFGRPAAVKRLMHGLESDEGRVHVIGGGANAIEELALALRERAGIEESTVSEQRHPGRHCAVGRRLIGLSQLGQRPVSHGNFQQQLLLLGVFVFA
ncbi:hypothetical protein SRL2020226_48020 [Mycobacterium kiyosense]|jgi:hypothetical protein|nr:hypothetical protein SRL2020226_48020 [Mycobacterium kiyosense]